MVRQRRLCYGLRLAIIPLFGAGPGLDLTAKISMCTCTPTNTCCTGPDLTGSSASDICQQVQWPTLAFRHEHQRCPGLGAKLQPRFRKASSETRAGAQLNTGTRTEKRLDVNASVDGPIYELCKQSTTERLAAPVQALQTPWKRSADGLKHGKLPPSEAGLARRARRARRPGAAAPWGAVLLPAGRQGSLNLCS